MVESIDHIQKAYENWEKIAGINHNIDELLVGVFTQISLRQGCLVEDKAKPINKVRQGKTNYG